jgi:O-antigen/teichoic acid export membrane protein
MTAVRFLRSRLGARAPSRVTRDGSALLVSTAGAAALSLLFWVVAARWYPTSEVGRASAWIAAVTLLAGLAQLNMLSVYLRFLPRAGNRTMAFLCSGYGAIVVVSVATGAVFLVSGLGRKFLWGYAVEWPVFALAVAVFALFVVQDGVLTTFGKAPWVPLQKLLVAAVKLAMLVALAASGSQVAITAAWCVPVAGAVCIVSLVVFRRLGPGQQYAAPDTELPSVRELAPFVTAEYLNQLLSTVVTFIPPLLVTAVLGVTSTAFFTVPWLIVMTMQTLLWNVVMPFIAETARHPEHLLCHTRQTVVLGAGVVIVGTVGLAVASPVVLRLQGPEFAAHGALLLQIVAASFPFTAVIVFAVALALIDRKLWLLVGVNGVAAATLVAGILLVLPHYGLTAVGAVHLFVQAGTATALAPGLVRRLRRADVIGRSRALADLPKADATVVAPAASYDEDGVRLIPICGPTDVSDARPRDASGRVP